MKALYNKRVMRICTALGGFISALFAPSVVYAQDLSSSVNNLDFNGVVRIVTGLACLAIVAAGGILVIMGIWSALQYMTAGDSKERAEKARKRITWYFIGGVVLLSYPFLINLVANLLKVMFGIAIKDIGFTCPF